MSDAEQRLSALEGRVQTLEDELTITRLILSYGPSVDSGNAQDVAELWEPDGSYDTDGWHMGGRAEIADMVHSQAHQDWIRGGCAHVIGAPHVTVSGEEAVAICYSLMVVHDGSANGFRVQRATANHWRLRKGSAGWRVTSRTNRVLNGQPEARDLLGFG